MSLLVSKDTNFLSHYQMFYDFLFKPVTCGHSLFYFCLNIVGQIAEEIDACTIFQFVDTDGVAPAVVVRTVSICLLHPVAHSLPLTASSAQYGSEEIFGNGDMAAVGHRCLMTSLIDVLYDVIAFVNGAAFADIKRV